MLNLLKICHKNYIIVKKILRNLFHRKLPKGIPEVAEVFWLIEKCGGSDKQHIILRLFDNLPFEITHQRLRKGH